MAVFGKADSIGLAMSQSFTNSQQRQYQECHACTFPTAYMGTPKSAMSSHELAVPLILLPYLQRTASDPRPAVLMTCGLAGK